MQSTSVEPVQTNVLAESILAAYFTRPAGSLTATANLHLAKNNRGATPTDTVADWTEADFHGYATIPLGAMLGPMNLPNGSVGMMDTYYFLMTSGGIGGTVYAYYITDTTNAILYYGEQLPTPMAFVNPGDFLELTVALPMTQAQFTGF